MNPGNNILKEVYELLEKDKLNEAINWILMDYTAMSRSKDLWEFSNLYQSYYEKLSEKIINGLRLQKGRLSCLRDDITNGFISSQDARIKRNIIRSAILDYINKIFDENQIGSLDKPENEEEIEVEIELKINEDIDNLDDEYFFSLIPLIKHNLKLNGRIKIITISKGSTILTIKVLQEDSKLIFDGINSGQFSSLNLEIARPKWHFNKRESEINPVEGDQIGVLLIAPTTQNKLVKELLSKVMSQHPNYLIYEPNTTEDLIEGFKIYKKFKLHRGFKAALIIHWGEELPIDEWWTYFTLIIDEEKDFDTILAPLSKDNIEHQLNILLSELKKEEVVVIGKESTELDSSTNHNWRAKLELVFSKFYALLFGTQ